MDGGVRLGAAALAGLRNAGLGGQELRQEGRRTARHIIGGFALGDCVHDRQRAAFDMRREVVVRAVEDVLGNNGKKFSSTFTTTN